MNALCLLLALAATAVAFRPAPTKGFRNANQRLKMEIEVNTATYVGIFVATLVPSLAFVKFVGDQADQSKEKLSDKQKMLFKKRMMETPGTNVGVTSEEEALKKQIAKAYMQDNDVDVAVLEEKLRLRAQWRKEILAQQKELASTEDDDGW